MALTPATPMPDRPAIANSGGPLSLVRLLQWVSPALPIGAYAYSHGLEWATDRGWVRDESGAQAWIAGLLHWPWTRLEVPVLVRCLDAAARGDWTAFRQWDARVDASRESAELLAEDRHLAAALVRVIRDAGIDVPATGLHPPPGSFVGAFALACVGSGVARDTAASGLLWMYLEHQVAAAVKLVPLGQSAGQRLAWRLAEQIPDCVRAGLSLADDEIGASLPGLAIASAAHETQYTRLFRS